MMSPRIDRNVVRHAQTARALVLASFLAGAIALAAFTSFAGASETPPKPTPPSVTTGTSHASGSGVALEGTVNPRGEAATYYFQYGPTIAYGSQTPSTSLPSGKTKVKVSQTVTGLLGGLSLPACGQQRPGPG